MAGLDPAIHVSIEDVDARDAAFGRPGHDGKKNCGRLKSDPKPISP
jgi:hypothetical protein